MPAKSEITIRQLLSHTSGISYPVIGSKEATAIYAKAGIPSGIGTPTGNLATSMDALGRLPLLHQPGERWTYGLSVDVVGRLVEVLSGQPLDQYLRTRLFEPLGMQDTWFYLPDRPAGAPGATLHRRRPEADHPDGADRLGMIPNYPNAKGTYFSGGAGLSSTIDDYAVFLQMMLNQGTYNGHRLLKPETVALMTQNQIGDVNQGNHKFGLGFSITPQGAKPLRCRAFRPARSSGAAFSALLIGSTRSRSWWRYFTPRSTPTPPAATWPASSKPPWYQSFVPDQKRPGPTIGK